MAVDTISPHDYENLRKRDGQNSDRYPFLTAVHIYMVFESGERTKKQNTI